MHTDSQVRELLVDARRYVAADVPTFETRRQALAAAESRCDGWSSGLDPIERWPSVSERFERLARELLLQYGVQEWVRNGGTLGPDGRPTLGNGSMPALEILTEVVAEPGHFTYLDLTGLVRAVFVDGVARGPRGGWHGLSLGGPHSSFLFSRRARRAAAGPWRSVLVPAGDGSSAFRSVNQPCDANRTGYASKRAEVFEVASQIVPLLWKAAEHQRRSRLTLEMDHFARALWFYSPGASSDDWRDLILDGIDAIAGLSIRSETFFKCGWRPRIESSRPTILRWRPRTRRQVEIHLSPRFCAFGQRWAAMLPAHEQLIAADCATDSWSTEPVEAQLAVVSRG